MKTTFLKTAAALILLTAQCYVCKAQKNNQTKIDSNNFKCLKLTLRLVDMKDKNLEGATVKLIKANNVENVKTGENKSKYHFNLQGNTYYTIEITYNGYITRRVAICTVLPKTINQDLTYSHEIEITMIPESSKGTKSDFLDFPAGLISYHKATDSFESDVKYSSIFKMDFELAKREARKEF